MTFILPVKLFKYTPFCFIPIIPFLISHIISIGIYYPILTLFGSIIPYYHYRDLLSHIISIGIPSYISVLQYQNFFFSFGIPFSPYPLPLSKLIHFFLHNFHPCAAACNTLHPLPPHNSIPSPKLLYHFQPTLLPLLPPTSLRFLTAFLLFFSFFSNFPPPIINLIITKIINIIFESH